MTIFVGIAVAIVLIGGLVYWFNRPVTWQDGEGIDEPDNPLLDTDLGSTRWGWMRKSDEGRVFGLFLTLRDWWENERLRWRK